MTDDDDDREEAGEDDPESRDEPEGEREGRAGRRGSPGSIATITLDLSRRGKPRGAVTVRGVKNRIGDSDIGGGIDLQDDDLKCDEAELVSADDGVYVISLNEDRAPRLNGTALGFKVPSRISAGDRIEIGNNTLLVKDVAHRRGDVPRYVGIKVIGKCKDCGMPLPLGGPAIAPRCESCQKENAIGPEVWKDILDSVLEGGDPGGGDKEGGEFEMLSDVTVSWAPGKPVCRSCGKGELPMDGMAVGTTGGIACPSCGAQAPTAPAPDWMRRAYWPAVQLYCADTAEAGDQAGPGGIALPQASKPVLLACPGCNAGLKITKDSSRTVACEYCSAEVYLPDDLWKRLHPVKTAGTWWVRFEGLSIEVRKARSEVDRAFAKAKDRAEKNRRRAEREAAAAAAEAAEEAALEAEVARLEKPPKDQPWVLSLYNPDGSPSKLQRLASWILAGLAAVGAVAYVVYTVVTRK